MKVYEYIVRIKDQASDKARRIANAFNNSRGPVNRFNSGMRNASQSTNLFGGAVSGLLRWIGPAVLGAALLTAGINSSKFARQMEQTQISFEVMLGSAQKASSLLGELTDLANVTPFTRTELQDSAKLLLNFGVSAEKIIPSVKMMGDISGGNAQKMHLMTLAFAQSSAAGRLMGQDLLQMINAGFNPLQEISAKTGISMAVLKKKMEAGAITTKMVEAAFRSATSEGGRFFRLMDRQSETFEGRLSTLRDKMEIWSGNMGKTINDFLSPLLDTAIKKIDMLLDKGNALKSENEKQLDSVRKVNTELKPMLDRYRELNKKGKLGRTAEEGLELVKIFTEVRDKFPQALKTIDGKAVGISSLRGRSFIENANKAFLEKNRSGISAAKAELKLIEANLKEAKNRVENPNRMFGETFADKTRLENLPKVVEFEQKRADIIQNILAMERSIQQMNDPFEKTTTVPGADDFAGLKEDKDKDKEEDALKRITGGGRQAVNVTINLDNLVGVQNFDVKNIKETAKDMSKLVTEELLKVLNSANYAASQ